MNDYRIDSHKLIYHVDRVNAWLSGEDVYPIYVEAATAGACNHRCTFCALDYIGYKPVFMDPGVLKTRLAEMGGLGIKSIMYAGEGEPLLHKDIAAIINHTKRSGIDVALTTNAVCMTEKMLAESIESITWIKTSINAATAETYAAVHGTSPEDFERVVGNIRGAVKMRKARGLETTIGMQMILLPENAGEAVKLAALAKEIGADYLVVKSYSQHLMSNTTRYSSVDYASFDELAEELAKFNDDSFRVVFRTRAMEKLARSERGYGRCMALPFWAYIDAGGGVWGCSAFLGDERFLYGNINDNTFEEIWKGEQRKRVMKYVAEELDVTACRRNCRMDEINRYLWELTHPADHVNFI